MEKRPEGALSGSTIRVSNGEYDHTGHLSRWQKKRIVRKERKAARKRLRDVVQSHSEP